MVTSIARAMVWGVSGLLGVRRDEPVAHGDVEHAHWDPVARRWFTHADGDPSSAPAERNVAA